MLDLWYRNAIIYSLDVETFLDSNGDGIGDFQGLTSNLDYLSGLNVNCVWLLPFYPSPNRDNGYDVTDFYGVDSRLGTLGDFVEFTHQARERGIRVLVDLVVNHTSIDHPWFQIARKNPDSIYRGYYVWSQEQPEDMYEGMVFPGVQESTWTWDDEAQAWYFHRFYKHQPDLNITNRLVREEISKIMGFWLQLGVSGFRVDAAPFLIELKGTNAPEDQDPYEYLRDFRNFLSWRRGDAVMLAEANVTPETVPHYFEQGNRVHIMFNFLANQYMFLALARGDSEPIRRAYRELPPIPATCQWANFLRNHDELDVGRLSDEERNEVYESFAPEENMRLYHRGIRRRLAPMLDNNRKRLELAYSLMLSLPGTPVLRYGDEIGMGDDLSLNEREAIRTPMQWNNSENAGFSSASADKLIHPIIENGEFGRERVNVEAQHQDSDSLLSWTERMLRVRRGCPEFGWGNCEFLDVGDSAVLAHRCSHEGRNVLVVHNLSDRHIEIDLKPQGPPGCLHDLLTRQPKSAEGNGSYRIRLDGWEFRWFREETGATERRD